MCPPFICMAKRSRVGVGGGYCNSRIFLVCLIAKTFVSALVLCYPNGGFVPLGSKTRERGGGRVGGHGGGVFGMRHGSSPPTYACAVSRRLNDGFMYILKA